MPTLVDVDLDRDRDAGQRPRSWPARIRWSSAAASAIDASSKTSTTALIAGLTRASRAIAACTASDAVISPPRTRAAISVAGRDHSALSSAFSPSFVAVFGVSFIDPPRSRPGPKGTRYRRARGRAVVPAETPPSPVQDFPFDDMQNFAPMGR
ncbi:MAG: hypothetical protein R3E48_18475 [Burkholderiaceae bacterium]